MSILDLYCLAGTLLSIIGALICWLNIISETKNKLQIYTGIILVICGMVITEMVVHSRYDTSYTG